MKMFLVTMMLIVVTLGASAQAKIRGSIPASGGSVSGGVKQVIVVSPRPYYNPYYSPFHVYSRWGYSPYGFGYNPNFGFGQASVALPTQLSLDIDRIRSDYKFQIVDVKRDKGVSKSERKGKIRELKHERSNAIIEARKDYYASYNQRP